MVDIGKPCDMHVHIVGNGTGGTGCWVRPLRWRRPMSALMLQHIGLPQATFHGDLDQIYANHLAKLLRESSLGSIVILAHEEVYRDTGEKMEDHGSFHIPNAYVLKLARENPNFLPAV